MRRIKKLLPDKYYLDKHFDLLVNEIALGITLDKVLYHDMKADDDEIRDIVSDVLMSIRPSAKTVNGKIKYF